MPELISCVLCFSVLRNPNIYSAKLQTFGKPSLDDGERVEFDWEHYPPGQDGYFYRATRVVRLPK